MSAWRAFVTIVVEQPQQIVLSASATFKIFVATRQNVTHLRNKDHCIDLDCNETNSALKPKHSEII